MNIYFLTNGIYIPAGTERVIVQLAEILPNVTIIVPGNKKIAFDGYEHLKILSANIGDFPKFGFFSKIKHRYKYYKALEEIISPQADDIFFSFSFDINLINVLYSKKFSCSSIICEHIEYGYHGRLRNILRSIIYKNKHAKLVCLTETDKKKFKADGIDAAVIPNFIHPIQNNYNLYSKKIISIGRLEYQKNFSFLIESFYKSKLYVEGWTLDIVGEGTEQNVLNCLIESLDLAPYVKIHKFTRRINEYYEDAALFCMTSRYEAFPMVLLEALNYRLPVLVTNFPTGAREILGSVNPQIVGKYDSSIFSESMRTLCNDVAIRNQYSIENTNLIQKFYPENISALWLNLINETRSKNL
ncbi:glycosyltransferase [Acinetobacter junii]|uniref:glycosyltransferase n=2 Tax=Acinetobacter junii TaxID=40215 RepID=UPI0012504E20|nr:glycosyltransferase [Acinetobacter junii]